MCKEISVIQVVGSNHADIGTKNEDVTLVEEKDNFLFLGLADGRSGCKYGKEGGEISLKELLNFVNDNDICQSTNGNEDEKREEIMTSIRRKLENVASFCNTNICEFSSTIVALVIDKVTGMFVVYHLGDGCILGVINEKIEFISTPSNGITNKHTWTTTSKTATEHLNITSGNIRDYSVVYLMSDGCDCFHQGMYIPFRGGNLLVNAEKEQLEKYVQQSEVEDDATIIVAKIRQL